MYRHFLELEALFEDHGVCSGVIIDSLALDRVLYEQRTLAEPLPSALQLVNRQKEVHFLSGLAVAYAVPPHTSEFTLQIPDLTHIWSGSNSHVIELDDILALAAAVYMCITLHLSLQQRYPRFPNNLQRSQRHLPDSNLMMSRNSTVRTPSSASRTSNSGCWNSW